MLPEFADAELTRHARVVQSNPRWWSGSAIVDGRFVVKFAWSEVCARRLAREARVLQRLHDASLPLPLPEIVATSDDPVLLVTRVVDGDPLTFEWCGAMTSEDIVCVGAELGSWLATLHGTPPTVIADLPHERPDPQADTAGLRTSYGTFVTDAELAHVAVLCDWVDEVLEGLERPLDVVVHGDFHGHNQVWDRDARRLRAVVDFEGCGWQDRHFDFRYLPGLTGSLAITRATMDAYERAGGGRLQLERVMAWHVLSALGDALWRSEAGAELPGGGDASSYLPRRCRSARGVRPRLTRWLLERAAAAGEEVPTEPHPPDDDRDPHRSTPCHRVESLGQVHPPVAA